MPGYFPRLEEMCDVHFKIPEYAEYRTAIGAALCYIRNREYKDILWKVLGYIKTLCIFATCFVPFRQSPDRD